MSYYPMSYSSCILFLSHIHCVPHPHPVCVFCSILIPPLLLHLIHLQLQLQLKLQTLTTTSSMTSSLTWVWLYSAPAFLIHFHCFWRMNWQNVQTGRQTLELLAGAKNRCLKSLDIFPPMNLLRLQIQNIWWWLVKIALHTLHTHHSTLLYNLPGTRLSSHSAAEFNNNKTI